MTSLQAVCVLVGEGVKGTVTFTQAIVGGKGDSEVKIEAEIEGLEAGKHGFHIHEFGDYSQGCISTGGHFNPKGVDHAGPTDDVRHVGDLGNIEAGEGPTKVNITDTVISLTGPESIIGRAVVVHAGEDDLGKTDHPQSKTTGNAGGRVACGVIGIAKLTTA